MLVYLGICAVVSFLAAVAAAFLGVSPVPTFGSAESRSTAIAIAVSPAATFHIAFAIGAMPLVFGAITHFVPVLTRSGAAPAFVHWLPLPVQAGGLIATLALGGWLPYASLHLAAAIVATAALTLALWIVGRLQRTLGAPHPGARWYVAALLALLLAVGLVPLWLLRPELHAALRLMHLHLNSLGFLGLAALGTLPVLLPTALGKPDPGATARLRSDIWLAGGGVFLVALGAASISLLAVAGALLLGLVVLRNLGAWSNCFGLGTLAHDGAAASLALATFGLALLLVLGLAHGAGLMSARSAIGAFAAAFLLPLVTGALTQLLPVWRFPGAATPARAAMRGRLAQWGQVRGLLFLCGGMLLAFDVAAGLAAVAAAMALFAVALLRALSVRTPRRPA